MKKLILISMAIMIAFAFTSCGDKELTKEEMLTQKKGWILNQATCSPDYQLNNDEWCDTDLLNGGFFFDCEKDDIFYFKDDKSFVMSYEKEKCDWNEAGKEENMGRWEFQENETWVQFYMGAYYDDENNEYFKLRGIIKELDKETLRLEVPINEDYPVAKSRMLRGEVHPYKGTFYLIFKVAK
ncbi:MAG: hypothetical protein FWH59_00140 [Lentimicrobiaceae bacterium]|nr:hypothetical protein [Lentimicrobiaceae bacterium]